MLQHLICWLPVFWNLILDRELFDSGKLKFYGGYYFVILQLIGIYIRNVFSLEISSYWWHWNLIVCCCIKIAIHWSELWYYLNTGRLIFSMVYCQVWLFSSNRVCRSRCLDWPQAKNFLVVWTQKSFVYA